MCLLILLVFIRKIDARNIMGAIFVILKNMRIPSHKLNPLLFFKPIRHLPFMLVCAACLALSHNSLADDLPQEFKNIKYAWPEAKFEWYYSSFNEPDWLPDGGGLDLFKKAAWAWSACGVEITYQGAMESQVNPKDQVNSLGWASLAERIRGLTLRRPVKGTSRLQAADIVINLNNALLQKNPTLLQKVVTHEFGHALGLIHSDGCSDVMSSAAECGWRIADPPPLVPTAKDLSQCLDRYGPEAFKNKGDPGP